MIILILFFDIFLALHEPTVVANVPLATLTYSLSHSLTQSLIAIELTHSLHFPIFV